MSTTELELPSGDLTLNLTGPTMTFTGLDLQIKGILKLIDMLDFKFAVDKDYDFPLKAFLMVLDKLGLFMRLDGDYGRERSNLEVVVAFLEWVSEDGLADSKIFKELLSKYDDGETDWSTLI
ncbi:hypothetical protein ACQKJC_24635 [Priestia koreensis]|uniref:hypothetical protein n=1 Tax=Priestia koreensis TaxID=284581 RepID=UPI003D022E82